MNDEVALEGLSGYSIISPFDPLADLDEDDMIPDDVLVEMLNAMSHEEVQDLIEQYEKKRGFGNSTEQLRESLDKLSKSNPTTQAAINVTETQKEIDLVDGLLQFDEKGFYIPTDANEPAYKKVDTRAGFKDIVEVRCYCVREKSNFCYACEVKRPSMSEAWRPLNLTKDDNGNTIIGTVSPSNNPKTVAPMKPIQLPLETKESPKVTPGAKTQKMVDGKFVTVDETKPTTTPSTTVKKSEPKDKWAGIGNDWGGYAYTPKDRHYGELFVIQEHDFYLSSSWNTRKEEDFIPDWGLYFDWGWHPWWRAEHIDWKDYSLPTDWAIAMEQLRVAIEKSEAGLLVEMGCIGAHGRTGTAVAAIGVILGMEAKEAIDYVRKEHCEHAIESEEQEWWIEWVYAQVNNTKCRPKPERKYKTHSKKTTNTGKTTASPATCMVQDHFRMWLEGKWECETGTSCRYWEEDLLAILENKLPYHAIKCQVVKDDDKDTMLILNDYRVPRPKYPSKFHTVISGKLCECDTCRYLQAGFEAFLKPANAGEALAWEHDMEALEAKAVEIIYERRLAAIASGEEVIPSKDDKKKDDGVIKVAQSDGTIAEVAISDQFPDRPPTGKAPINGTRKGDWVYLDGQGWVWEKVAKAVFPRPEKEEDSLPMHCVEYVYGPSCSKCGETVPHTHFEEGVEYLYIPNKDDKTKLSKKEKRRLRKKYAQRSLESKGQ